MVLIRQQFKVAAVGALFALSLLAVTGVTARAQWRDDPYYGRSSKEQRKSEKEAQKRRRKEEKEWEKRERKEEKEERKARERRERDGDYDDEYDYDRDDRDRGYDDGRGDYGEFRREAYERGAREGLRAGESDRANGRGRDYDRHRAYRDASAGYSDRYGDRGAYQESFREGFRRGYDEGFNGGGTNRRTDTGWGRILGDIIGRP